MNAAIAYPLAAVAEISGCFAIWAWWRLGASPLWLFGWLLAQVETSAAGRAFAAYGGIYIGASMLWMWFVEGERPDRWDFIGTSICLIGAAIILSVPRGT